MTSKRSTVCPATQGGILWKSLPFLLALLLPQFAHAQYNVGDKVEVEERGKWYLSSVLKVEGDKFFIHYEGYSSKYDLWVGSERIRSVGGNQASQSTNAGSIEVPGGTWTPKAESAPTQYSAKVPKSGSMTPAMKSEFLDLVRVKYAVAVQGLCRPINPNFRASNNSTYGPPDNAQQLKEALASLAELDQLCKTKYKGLYDDETVWKDHIDKLPGTIATIAANRLELAQTVVKDKMREKLGRFVNELSQRSEDVKAKNIYVVAGSFYATLYAGTKYSSVMGIRATDFTRALVSGDMNLIIREGTKDVEGMMDVISEAMEKRMPVDDLLQEFKPKIESQTKSLAEQCKSNIPEMQFAATFKDATAEAAAKKAVTAHAPKASILKTGMMSADWTVRKNSLGIPTHRVKVGGVYFKDGATGQNMYASIVYRQEYQGGGYGEGKVSEYTEYFVK